MPGWWVTQTLSAPNGTVLLASHIFWVIFAIVLHELAHGWAAMACGDDTPRATGHMTWNPVVHMGVPSLFMFALIGIAWGAMPVNPSRFRRASDDAIVALAGPLMNIALVLLTLPALAAWILLTRQVTVPAHVQANIFTFLYIGSVLNIALALFNLLPVPPLDGSRILSVFVPAYRNLFASEIGRVAMIILMVVLFTQGGTYIFGAGHYVVNAFITAVIPALPTTP